MNRGTKGAPGRDLELREAEDYEHRTNDLDHGRTYTFERYSDDDESLFVAARCDYQPGGG